MSTRTVRLDVEEERLLAELVHKPFDVYRQLDLGPGGYASRPSTESRRGAREAIVGAHRW